MKQHDEGGADADRLTRCAAQILSAQSHDASAEQISRISRGLAWKRRLCLRIFKILRCSFFAAQCFVKQRAVCRAAMQLLDTRLSGTARRFEKAGFEL